MSAHGAQQRVGLEAAGEGKDARIRLDLAVDLACALDAAERLQAKKIMMFSETLRVDDDRAARFDAAMSVRLGLRGRVVLLRLRQARACIRQQRVLIALESETIVAASLDNACRHLAVAVQRVGSDNDAFE